VIGADGVHSVVRDLSLGPMRRSTRTHCLPRDFSVLSAQRQGNGFFSNEVVGADRHIVIYYTNALGNELYFVTSVPEPGRVGDARILVGERRLKELAQGVRRFPSRCSRRGSKLPGLPQVGDPSNANHLRAGAMDEVVLLGRRLHPMTPYMAQWRSDCD